MGMTESNIAVLPEDLYHWGWEDPESIISYVIIAVLNPDLIIWLKDYEHTIIESPVTLGALSQDDIYIKFNNEEDCLLYQMRWA